MKKMSNYIDEMNTLVRTKSELKEIIIESGQTPGEVFSYYPNMIRNAIAAGGGSLVDYPTYTYVATYYPDFTYLFSYVGDALSGIDVDIDLSSYVTKDELSTQSYATTTDLSNYLPYLGVLQAHYTNSEHFLPKANNTYYLGNTNFKWQRIYTYNLYSGNIVLSDTYNSIVNASNTRINFQINQNNRFKMTNVEFAPVSNNGVNLGTSSEKFNKTYTSNIYADNLYTYSLTRIYSTSNYNIIFNLNGANRFSMDTLMFSPINDNTRNLGSSTSRWANTYTANLWADNIHNFIWTGTSAEYAALDNYTSYQIYMIKES